MAVFILDTTTLTHLQRNHARVSAVHAAHAAETVGITTVNVEEVIGGWFAYLNRAKSNAQEAIASENLAAAMTFLRGFPVYATTENALDRYDLLVRLKLNVGKRDLKIAAIALELDATVVTDNAIDFGRVPSLKWEDWTK